MNNIKNKILEDKILQKIKPQLKNIKAYLVGGYIRDLFLGKNSLDRDIIIIDENVEILAKNIAQKIGATFIELDKNWGIYRLVLSDKKNYIDIAQAIENNLEKDINRRDITINSIAYNLNTEEFYDPNNGINDIKAKIIKGINEENFVNDPLRLLRVFRFQSTLGFEIEPRTYKYIENHVELITQPAKERLNVELLKLFEGNNTTNTLKKMDKIGLLNLIFPFIVELKKIPPNSHHHLDLFNHSLETVHQIEQIIPTLQDEAKEILNKETFGTVKKLAYLKIGAFMHDIGKPQTWTIDEKTNRHRFIFHDSKGAEIAPQYLKFLKFSKKQISYIKILIKNHIYPSNVNINNEKSIMKFLRKMDENTVDIIVLAMADRLSARGKDITEDIVKQNISQLNTIMAKYFEVMEEIKPLPKLIDGNEIMEILQISPSPILGKIIGELKAEQDAGNITTYEEAREFVKNYKI